MHKAKESWLETSARSKLIQSELLEGLELEICLSLLQVHPPVWRTLRVPASMPLDVLHTKALCPAMGWTCADGAPDQHAHAFRLHVTSSSNEMSNFWWGDPKSQHPDKMHVPLLYGGHLLPESKLVIGEVFLRDNSAAPDPEAWLEWVYDLGDHWCHSVTLVSVGLRAPNAPKTVVLEDGSGNLA